MQQIQQGKGKHGELNGYRANLDAV